MKGNKMKYFSTAALVIGMATTSLAYAGQQGDSYGGLNLALGTYSEDGFEDFNPKALVGRFGKFTSDNLAVEGRLGFGMGGDSQEISGIDLELEVNNLFGIYTAAHAPLNANSSVYGILGLTRGKLSATVESNGFNSTVEEADTSLSFGFGLTLGDTEGAKANLEFMRYMNTSEYTYDAIGLGISFDI